MFSSTGGQNIYMAISQPNLSTLEPLCIYIDANGRQLFAGAAFHPGESFSEGYAVVGLYSPDEIAAGQQQQYAYINTLGEIQGTQTYTQAYGFHGGIAVAVTLQNHIQILNINTQTATTVEDDAIYTVYDYTFHDGLLQTSAGYMNADGEIVIHSQGLGSDFFSEGFAAARDNDGKLVYLDVTGAAALKTNHSYDPTQLYVHAFSNGLAVVQTKDGMGYINKAGEVAIPLQFDGAAPFSEGLAAACKDGLWGYIDTEGEVVVDFLYQYAHPFSEGVAAVADAETGLVGVIDTTGTLIVDFQFDSYYSASSIYVPSYKMKNGLMQVMSLGGPSTQGGRWFGYINRDGTVVYKSSDV